MSEKIKIDYLANHLERVAELAAWFYDEWREYYSSRTVEDVAESIRQRANTDKVPLTLVAFCGDELVGTICIKQYDMDGKTDLSPWLAGLYVASAYRARGIGGHLLDAILQQAYLLRIHNLYLWTPQSESYYAKRGWLVLERTEYKGAQVSIMAK